MLNKEDAKEVLDACLSTGADYAELFFEDTYHGAINMLSGKVDSVETEEVYGVGIRILKELEEVYGYTNDTSKDGMLNLALRLNKSFNAKVKNIKYELKEETASGYTNIKRPSKDVSYEEKIPYLKTVSDAVFGYSPLISQALVRLEEFSQYVTIANTKGKFVHDLRNQQRINTTAYAKHENRNQSIRSSIGGNFDIDEYKNKDLVKFGQDLAKATVTMVDAPEMVGGVYPVVLHNGFGGVLFHEACGHPLEATSVAPGLSVFSGKKGDKIASDIVTAIDDGTIFGEWGTTNVDDEGNPTKKNVLIKDGILTSYMVDMRNGRRMKEEPTGNTRRENYKYSPTSRMTNTYIANGKSKFEDIIKATKYGLFAKSLGGGSVNPLTGEFNFAVNEGYMIEDGKITTPVRGATLIGNGANALLNIDMVADNQTFGHGVCGSKSGSICANVGEPTIRILNMTVGGNGGRK